jgi:DNA-binding transcriptional MerR regulator
MSGRTYLSIGDVLALLRQEFPDVTISKIRFLESQGLVNPERTPSGYRKFYEHDVERLRWVLRQQREHFLPLKVIKGRLEQEGADYGEAGDDNGHDGVAGTEEQAEPVLAGRAQSSPSAAKRELPGFETPVTGARRSPAPGRTVTAATRSGLGTSAPASPAGRSASAAPTPAASAAPGTASVGSAANRRPSASPARAPAETGGAHRAPTTATGAGPGGPTKVSGGAAMRSHDVGAVPTGAGHRGVPHDNGDEDAVDELVVGALSGASMTLQELAQGSGLDAAAVEQLESYGLMCGRVVGGVSYYDEDALIVARVAAGLARYGVEARHLRLHKHAAEREAGFIEQIVVPLLKQRNPEARQRAHEITTELTLLSQTLREVLLRTTLRDQLGR